MHLQHHKKEAKKPHALTMPLQNTVTNFKPTTHLTWWITLVQETIGLNNQTHSPLKRRWSRIDWPWVLQRLRRSSSIARLASSCRQLSASAASRSWTDGNYLQTTPTQPTTVCDLSPNLAVQAEITTVFLFSCRWQTQFGARVLCGGYGNGREGGWGGALVSCSGNRKHESRKLSWHYLRKERYRRNWHLAWRAMSDATCEWKVSLGEGHLLRLHDEDKSKRRKTESGEMPTRLRWRSPPVMNSRGLLKFDWSRATLLSCGGLGWNHTGGN